MRDKLRVLSMFDGIGGALQALPRDVPIVYFSSEIDPVCTEVARRAAEAMPNVEFVSVGDARCVPNVLQGERIDLMVGGSPCQDLSSAKATVIEDKVSYQGILGPKSRLFFDFLAARSALRPKRVLLENVATMRIRDRDVIDSLLGLPRYKVSSALYTGQKRDRYYWTDLPFQGRPVGRADMSHALEDRVPDSYLIPKKLEEVYRLLQPGQWWKHLPNGHPAKEKVLSYTKGSTSGLTGVYRVYSKDTYAPTLTASGIRQQLTRFVLYHQGVYRYPTPLECERLQGFPDGYTAGHSDAKRYSLVGNAFTVPVVQGFIGEASCLGY